MAYVSDCSQAHVAHKEAGQLLDWLTGRSVAGLATVQAVGYGVAFGSEVLRLQLLQDSLGEENIS